MTLLELRILGIVGIIAALWIGYGVWHHHVEQGGVTICENKHSDALKVANKTATAKIKKVEVKYEGNKKTVYQIQGDNPAVGPRVDAALRGMPERAGDR